ncbi:hypothetical protein BC941DRAFT_439311 [Chlamydoabsidia padenii]|nr:hypothetical protein BC941DRAFT_439311 [Chlamydoabsidia padenii]
MLSSPTLLSDSPNLSSSHSSTAELESHFVQALHDFFPANAPTDNVTACLFFQRGAIIEVYNRDESGWWDGVTDGVRGWFPSNYVGQIGELRRYSADYEDLQDTPQLKEFENWRQGLTTTNNMIKSNSTDNLSVSQESNHYATNVISAMSQRSYSQSSNASINYTNKDDDKINHQQYTPNRVELARALLNEDRQKFVTESSNVTGKYNTPNMNYLLQDANNRISDLVEDCSQEHLTPNIQLVIFQVVSSIRTVLSAANTVSKNSPLLKSYPELALQRKNVLASLSRLVLKGKELQALSQYDDDQSSCQKVQYDIPSLANQLLADMDMFENVLRSIIPAYEALSDDDDDDSYGKEDSDSSTQGDDQYAQHNNNATISRYSDQNLGAQQSLSTTNNLRKDLVAARLSSASLIAQVVPLSDAQNIMETITNHQVCIDELVEALLVTVEEFLAARQRATHMLEMARKAVEAVRAFLAVIEHVCSNVGDLDYKQSSVIPEDPHLVALVLAKEAVYSAITNLVTAVRALTGPRNQLMEDTDDDLLHLQSSCKSVTKATINCASCVRTCLYVDDPVESTLTMASLSEMRDKFERSTDSRRDQTLSVLGRKVTSLNVLQRQYSSSSNINDGDGDNANRLLYTGNESNNIDQDLGFHTASTRPLDDIHEIPSHLSSSKWIQHQDDTETPATQQRQCQPVVSSSEPSKSPATSTTNDVLNGYQRHRTQSIPSMLSDNSQCRSSVGSRSNRSTFGKSSRSSGTAPTTQRRSHTTTRSSLTASISSIHTGSSRPLSDRSSVESFTMTPLTTPEAMSPVTEYDDDIPLGQQLKEKRDTYQQRTSRPRSSSINALAITPPSNQQSLVMTQRMPLPPIPPSPLEPPSDLKPTSSKSTPTSDHSKSSTKTRRPRGMSVTALRMSFKQKNDDQRASKEHMVKKSINRISSRSSLQSSDQNSINDNKMENEPFFLKQRQFSDDEVILNADGQLTGATIEILVEKLTLHEKSPDLVFTRAFFYNFRLFTSPSAFIDLLIQRFRLSPPSDPVLSDDDLNLWKSRVLVPIRLRVYNVIKIWMETYYRYEQDDVESQLLKFANEDMEKAMPGPAKRMVDLIKKTFETQGHSISHRKMSYAICSTSSSSHASAIFSTNGSNGFLSEYSPSRPSLNNKSSSGHLSLSSGSSLFSDLSTTTLSSSSALEQVHYPPINLTRSLRNSLRKAVMQNNLTMVHINDFDCMELARQFTLMESALFCQITPYELIGQEFKKKVGQSTAIHVKAMIQKSTQVTSWVCDTILREQDAKRRAQMLKFWIKVGDCCLQMNNYNTLMAIRSALDSTSIRRLKRSWDVLSAKYKTMLEPIYRATDSSRNFAEYRARLKMAVAPCLPFLGVYLTDMTFIDDGNSNHRTTPSGHILINFDKYVKTTRVLNEIDQFQIPYKLLEVEEIQRYLTRCLETVEKDEQIFYNRSVALEPRQEESTINDIRHTISQLT